MQRKRQAHHWYTVYVASYVSLESKARAENHEEDITRPEQVDIERFYSGSSKPRADAAFGRAALSAMSNPRTIAVVMDRDFQTIIRVRVER